LLQSFGLTAGTFGALAAARLGLDLAYGIPAQGRARARQPLD